MPCLCPLCGDSKSYEEALETIQVEIIPSLIEDNQAYELKQLHNQILKAVCQPGGTELRILDMIKRRIRVLEDFSQNTDLDL